MTQHLRILGLVASTADTLKEMDQPLHGEWLLENQVDVSELAALHIYLGRILQGFVNAPDYIQETILACADSNPEDAKALTHIIMMKTHFPKLNRQEKE